MGEINGSTLYLLFWFLCMSNHWQLTFIEQLCKHIYFAKMLETRLLLLKMANCWTDMSPSFLNHTLKDSFEMEQDSSSTSRCCLKQQEENSILAWQTNNWQRLMKVNMAFNENDLLQLSHRCFSFMGCPINRSEWLTGRKHLNVFGLIQKTIWPQPVSFFI